jgi:hypothetical protein
MIAATGIEHHRVNLMLNEIRPHRSDALPMALEISSRVQEHKVIGDVKPGNQVAQIFGAKKVNCVSAVPKKEQLCVYALSMPAPQFNQCDMFSCVRQSALNVGNGVGN